MRGSARPTTVTNPTTDGDKTQADVTFDRIGSFRVTLNVADSSSPRQSANNTINCAINADPLQVVNFAKVPDGKDIYNTGDSIRFTVSAARGVSPYVYRWETSQPNRTHHPIRLARKALTASRSPSATAPGRLRKRRPPPSCPSRCKRSRKTALWNRCKRRTALARIKPSRCQ